jgi:CHRD domain
MKTLTLGLLFALLVIIGSPVKAATILFDLQGTAGVGLLGGNEAPTPVTGGGSGGESGAGTAGISYDDATKILSINVKWGSANGFTDLTGVISGAHIHGPTAGSGTTAFTQTAGVVVNFATNGVTAGYTAASFVTNTSASAGSVSGQVTLDATREAQLLAGRLYLNFHTATNVGGEIRGNLVQVPEPSRATFALLGLSLLAFRRKR